MRERVETMLRKTPWRARVLAERIQHIHRAACATPAGGHGGILALRIDTDYRAREKQQIWDYCACALACAVRRNRDDVARTAVHGGRPFLCLAGPVVLTADLTEPDPFLLQQLLHIVGVVHKIGVPGVAEPVITFLVPLPPWLRFRRWQRFTFPE